MSSGIVQPADGGLMMGGDVGSITLEVVEPVDPP